MNKEQESSFYTASEQDGRTMFVKPFSSTFFFIASNASFEKSFATTNSTPGTSFANLRALSPLAERASRI
jgi:hypothetical protein